MERKEKLLMMREKDSKLKDLQSKAVHEINRIMDSDSELFHYQTDLQTLLHKVASPEHRVKTLSMMIAANMSKIKTIVKELEY